MELIIPTLSFCIEISSERFCISQCLKCLSILVFILIFYAWGMGIEGGKQTSEMSFFLFIQIHFFTFWFLLFQMHSVIYLIKHKMLNTRTRARALRAPRVQMKKLWFYHISRFHCFSPLCCTIRHGRWIEKPAHQLVINFTIEKRNKIKNK